MVESEGYRMEWLGKLDGLCIVWKSQSLPLF
jgi:hypothetical protein